MGGGTKALLLLGKIYRTTGEYDRAVEAYDQILRKTPGDSEAREGRRKAVEPPWASTAARPAPGGEVERPRSRPV